eukprot:PhM_4_TR13071/c0_g1_i1/m.74967
MFRCRLATRCLLLCSSNSSSSAPSTSSSSSSTGGFVGRSALDDIEDEYFEADAQSRRRTMELNNGSRVAVFDKERLRQRLALRSAPMDSIMTEDSVERDTHRIMMHMGKNPQDHFISDNYVRITHIEGGDGKLVPLDTAVECSLREAIAMAQDTGMNVVQSAAAKRVNAEKVSMTEVVLRDGIIDALCDVQTQYTFDAPKKSTPVFEVILRGVTEDHAIWFKSVAVVKELRKRVHVRIEMSKFGTIDEGLPVLEKFLRAVAKECKRHGVGAHTVSPIEVEYDSIRCYLIPPTRRNRANERLNKLYAHDLPGDGGKSTYRQPTRMDEAVHPTKEELEEVRLHRKEAFEEEMKEPLMHGSGVAPIDQMRYEKMIDAGTAWTYKDEGLTLSKQRREKVMGGWLPKGKKKLHQRRGDVENYMPKGHDSSPNSIDAKFHPKERNTEQAERGIGTILKRYKMSVTDMHDRGETADAPTTLGRFHYRMSGNVFDVKRAKQATGITKDRRGADRVPNFASQFGTGVSAVDMHEHMSKDGDQP